jgi:ABC-type cobalamin/Fe3+-siderophores transport system ATPase subunit
LNEDGLYNTVPSDHFSNSESRIVEIESDEENEGTGNGEAVQTGKKARNKKKREKKKKAKKAIERLDVNHEAARSVDDASPHDKQKQSNPSSAP